MWGRTLALEVDGSRILIGCTDADVATRVSTALGVDVEVANFDDIIPTFGMATARVGLRRREVGLLYHGRQIRHRAATVQDAAKFLAELLAPESIERDTHVRLPLRVFAADHAAVLVDCNCKEFIDEFGLSQNGIRQRALLWADVDPDRRTVLTADGELPVAGLVVSSERLGVDREVRNHLADLAERGNAEWAWMVDALQDRIVVSETLTDAIRELGTARQGHD